MTFKLASTTLTTAVLLQFCMLNDVSDRLWDVRYVECTLLFVENEIIVCPEKVAFYPKYYS